MANGVWNRISKLTGALAGAAMPRSTELLFDVVTGEGKLGVGPELARDRDYFGLTINQINLTKGREFWSTYDPLVYVAIDFVHGRERITVPRLIGPSALKSGLAAENGELPHGFVVRNIRVAGPHPYRGEQVGITVILYKVRHTDYAKRVLRFAENLSDAFGLPAEIASITKIGGSVVDAMETLFDMGDSEPVLGHRTELNASPLHGFQSRCVALIGATGDPADTGLKVSDGRLLNSSGEDYQVNDYVLYSVWGIPSNENETRLPFYELVPKMNECALAGDPESWQRGKSILVTLYQQMLTSPDLTATDADRLFDRYKTEMLKLKKKALDVTLMATPKTEKSQSTKYRSDVLHMQLNKRAQEILSLPG
jgi:hypothetical protein